VLVRTVRVRIWLAAGASMVAAVAVWALWPAPAPAPHARVYLNASACLLTGPGGIAPGTPAAPVWAAMESASLATHVMVSYLPDTGPADVPVMLNTLVERQCGVIVTTGAAAGPVTQAAQANPHERFLLVAAPSTAISAVTSNVVVIAPSSAPGRIDQALHALAANTES
jgi:hypothetical protein